MKIEISQSSNSIFFTGYAQLHIDSYPKLRVVEIKIKALIFCQYNLDCTFIYHQVAYFGHNNCFSNVLHENKVYFLVKIMRIYSTQDLRFTFVILVCSPIQCSSYYMKLLIHSLDGMNVKSRMFRPRRKKKNVK